MTHLNRFHVWRYRREEVEMTEHADWALLWLAEENPVPDTEAEGVATEALALLPHMQQLVADETASGHGAWRPGRRWLISLAVALVAFAAVLGGSALGIGPRALDFFHAERAPANVVRNFHTLTRVAPPWTHPDAIANQTRRVPLVNDKQILWVAPTKAGGYCALWVGIGGNCDRIGTVPLDVVWLPYTARLGSASRRDRFADGLRLIAGVVNSNYADRVEIRFDDGRTVSAEVIWVSEPIHEGFFIYRLSGQRLIGDRVRSVAALDKNGEIVTEETAPGAGAGSALVAPPVDAIAMKKRAALIVSTSHGKAVVWQAPTRYDGRCVWLEFEGKNVGFASCRPRGYDWNAGISTRFMATHDSVLVVGTVGRRYREIDLSYADGRSSRVRPKHPFFVFVIPDAHLAPGHELVTLQARGAGGRTLARFVIPAGGNPCDGVLPLKRGTKCR